MNIQNRVDEPVHPDSLARLVVVSIYNIIDEPVHSHSLARKVAMDLHSIVDELADRHSLVWVVVVNLHNIIDEPAHPQSDLGSGCEPTKYYERVGTSNQSCKGTSCETTK